MPSYVLANLMYYKSRWPMWSSGEGSLNSVWPSTTTMHGPLNGGPLRIPKAVNYSSSYNWGKPERAVTCPSSARIIIATPVSYNTTHILVTHSDLGTCWPGHTGVNSDCHWTTWVHPFRGSRVHASTSGSWGMFEGLSLQCTWAICKVSPGSRVHVYISFM